MRHSSGMVLDVKIGFTFPDCHVGSDDYLGGPRAVSVVKVHHKSSNGQCKGPQSLSQQDFDHSTAPSNSTIVYFSSARQMFLLLRANLRSMFTSDGVTLRFSLRPLLRHSLEKSTEQ